MLFQVRQEFLHLLQMGLQKEGFPGSFRRKTEYPGLQSQSAFSVHQNQYLPCLSYYIKFLLVCGMYNPTKSFTSVVLPEPEGPTKAIVSPFFT